MAEADSFPKLERPPVDTRPKAAFRASDEEGYFVLFCSMALHNERKEPKTVWISGSLERSLYP
jgi:hypothetical protein